MNTLIWILRRLKMSNKQDLFISVDIETDGPIPGEFSLLSIGAAAINGYTIVDTFSINLEQLEGAKVCPRTKEEFWDKQPEAWEACRKNVVAPETAMQSFDDWIVKLRTKHGKPPTFVASPAGFDFTFCYWYFIKFLGRSPFSFSALDMKTLAMALLHEPYSQRHSYKNAVKRNMPKEWFSNRPHNHIALDDALEQADLFISMLKTLDQKSETIELQGKNTRFHYDKQDLARTLEDLHLFLNGGEI